MKYYQFPVIELFPVSAGDVIATSKGDGFAEEPDHWDLTVPE